MYFQRTSANTVTLHFASGRLTLEPTQSTIGDYVITEPGEYDIAGIAVEAGVGYAVVSGDQQHVLVVGPVLGRTALDELLALEDVSVVVLWPPPTEAESSRALARIVADLEPRAVVVLGSSALAKTVTGQTADAVDRVKIQAADLEAEDRRVWVLE